MVDPNSVKSYIGCFSLYQTINLFGFTYYWIVCRQNDALMCQQIDQDGIRKATVFAFYLGDTFTPAPPFNNHTHTALQVQSMVDGKWLACDGTLWDVTHNGSANTVLASPDTPPTLCLASNSPYGIPPATNALWMEFIENGAVGGVLSMNSVQNVVNWQDPTLAALGANPSLAITAYQVLPGASDLNKGSHDRVDFRYIFLKNAVFTEARVTNCDLSNVTFSGVADFSGAVLDGSNFSGRMLDSASFRNASLKNVDLSGASLKGCDFAGAVLDNCNLEGANLTGADLSLATLVDPTRPVLITRSAQNRTVLTNARVNKVLTHALNGEEDDIYDWSYAQMDGAAFMTPDADNPGKAIADGQLDGLVAQYAVLTGVQFSVANPLSMRYADLSFAQLGGAALVNANLEDAKFDSATFSTSDGKRRCNLTSAILMNATFGSADLSYALMPYCYLYGNKVTLADATIMQADFSGAYLVAADFSGLRGKNAAGVTFDGACLVNANFSGTDLSTVDQQRANSFAKACLQGANFTSTKSEGVNFAGAAVSTGDGTLTVQGGREDGHQIDYSATLTPTDTAGATCPSGQTGPCTGAMWSANGAPMNEWHYGDNT
ncbi:pentapeptide repeat-containing protein [Burkholderia vietnamiensis]|nr:pentapeptide repeat-containing protein [Burkholderia vietnamiensis]